MNRRSMFKTLAALPLALLTPKAAAKPPLAVGMDIAGQGQTLTGVFASGADFVPRDGLAYLHRGEPRTIMTTWVLPPHKS